MTELGQMDDSRERSWVSGSEGGGGAQRQQQDECASLRSVRSIDALFLFADPSPSLPLKQFLIVLGSLSYLVETQGE